VTAILQLPSEISTHGSPHSADSSKAAFGDEEANPVQT
jgi:hypothetical protein